MTPTREQWRAIPGWAGEYEVSDQGRVRSLERAIWRSSGNRMLVPGRVLSEFVDDVGRHSIRLSRAGQQTTRRISVLVLEAFVGPRPTGFHGCHNDGNPGNNNLGNLRWDTASANVLDAVRHGTNNEVRKTHCPRGHLLAEPNLSPSRAKVGKRVCLACHRALCARRRAGLRGEPFDMQRVSDTYHRDVMRAA